MTPTKIETTDSQIIVTGDYNSAFVTKAQSLSGKWVSPSWFFDIRDEAAVRAASLECYGTDGGVADLVDVQITIPTYAHGMGSCKPIELFGRSIARAFGRDSGAKLGTGIVLVEGGFTSGGSMKNWCTDVKDNTVVIMRDVSRKLFELHNDDDFIVELIEPEKSKEELLDDAVRDEIERKCIEVDKVDVRTVSGVLTVLLAVEEGSHIFRFKNGVLVQYFNTDLISADMEAETFTTDPVGVTAHRLLLDAGLIATK